MKSILLSTFSAWLGRLVAILLNLVGIPLSLKYLGSSEFALLLVILSIGSWLGFANIGMGRVVANIVARSRRWGRFTTEAVSTATALAAIANLILFFGGTALFVLVMSQTHPTPVIAENYHEFLVTTIGLFFALSLWFFLSVFEGVDAGRHQLHRLYFFQLASYILSFAVLLLAFPRFPSIAFAACLLNLGFLFGSTVHAIDVFRRNRSLFTNSFKWRPRLAKLMMLSSFDFMMMNLGLGIIFQLATGLFGFIYGPDTVIELGIFMRLIQSYGSLVIAFTYPLSNIVATKLKMREVAAARRTARMSCTLLMAAAGLAGVIFFIFGTKILSFWLRSDIQLDLFFRINASALIILSALHFFLAALLIGTGSIRSTSRLQVCEAVAFIPLVFVLFLKFQQGGALLAMNLAFAVGSVIMFAMLRRHNALGAHPWRRHSAPAPAA